MSDYGMAEASYLIAPEPPEDGEPACSVCWDLGHVEDTPCWVCPEGARLIALNMERAA